MKPLPKLQAEKSAKQFLLKLVPTLLSSCGVDPEQKVFGVKINIQAEANKRIWAMSEETAEKALKTLDEELKQWRRKRLTI